MTGCTSGKPEPIQFGVDSCGHCKMTITDRRFGGEVVTAKGKITKFDTLECLTGFLRKNPEPNAKIYIVDTTQAGALIPSDTAIFKIDPQVRSPMGKGIFSSQKAESLDRLFATGAPSSKQYRWSELEKELVETPFSQ